MIPADERPIVLVARSDLHYQQLDFRDSDFWVVKDPVSLNYHRLREEQYELLQLLDGQVNLQQIQRKLQALHPQEHWRALDIQLLLNDLHQKGLLVSDRFGQSTGLRQQQREHRKRQLISVLSNFLFLRFPGIYPDRFLKAVYPLVAWMFHPVSVILSLLLILSTMGFLSIHFDEFRRQLPSFHQFFGWPNLLYLWATLAVIKIFHELGHGLTCKHYGGECHSIGVMLLVFSPTLYCDVSDSWMMPNKWHRIAIGAAGMYVEMVISAFAILLWWNTELGMVHHLALNVFFVTSISTAIFNANPLMRLDGYYILSDWLEMPNLKQRADKFITSRFTQLCFGLEPAEDPFEPPDGKWWLGIYAIASSIYRFFLMITIGWFIYTVLKPYRLEVLGLIVLTTSLGTLFARPIVQIVKFMKTQRQETVKKGRVAISICAVSVLLLAVALIPVPIYLEASVLVQPHDVRHVYSQSPGTLRMLKVAAGDFVEQDQLLMHLQNHELEDRRREIDHEIALQKARFDTANALRDPAQKQLALRRLQTLEEQREEISQQLQSLRILAPVPGRVVAAQSRPKPKVDRAEQLELTQWTGELLQTYQEGAQIPEKTHVLSIAPSERLDVVLFISQDDRNELSIGQEVGLKFDHLPTNLYRARIDEIASEPVEFVPSSLSNKTGGPLATVTDPEGRERLSSAVWQARVSINQDADLFVSGLRGRARCLVTRRSLGGWIWNNLREIIHFRM